MALCRTQTFEKRIVGSFSPACRVFSPGEGIRLIKNTELKLHKPTPTAPLESLCPLNGGGGYVCLRGADWPWVSFGCIPSFLLSSSQRPSEVSCVSLTAPRCSPPLSAVTLRATPTACCHCLVCVWRGSRGRPGAPCHHSWEPLGHPSSSLSGREETFPELLQGRWEVLGCRTLEH